MTSSANWLNHRHDEILKSAKIVQEITSRLAATFIYLAQLKNMAAQSSYIYRAVSNALKRVWNKPVRYIKQRTIYPLWRYGPRAWWARYRHLLPARLLRSAPAGMSPQFRSGGKLASVLLPSRGRPAGLFNAVSSIIARCDRPESVEILIRLDDDDHESQKAVKNMKGIFGDMTAIRTIIGPRGAGYTDLHKFVEELCAVARGDFLVLFNDDTLMDTNGWDAELGRFRNELCVLRLHCPIPRECSHLTGFPAVHRKVHQIIGHFSLSCWNDAWIQHISRGAGIERRCRVRVTHNQKMDATLKERDEALALQQSHRENSSARRKLREEKQRLPNADLAKVKSYLDRHGVQLQRIESAS